MSLDRLLAGLDADPDKRGREFERVSRWYLTNAPEYQGRFKQVWLWREWPDAWGPDAGIDLVAEEQDGGLWAIQARSARSALKSYRAGLGTCAKEAHMARVNGDQKWGGAARTARPRSHGGKP